VPASKYEGFFMKSQRSQSLPIIKEYISVSNYTLLNNEINQKLADDSSPICSRKSNQPSYNNSLSDENTLMQFQPTLSSSVMIKRKSFATSRINYLDWYVTKDSSNNSKLVCYTFERQSGDSSDLSGAKKNSLDVSRNCNYPDSIKLMHQTSSTTTTPGQNRRKKFFYTKNLLRPEWIPDSVAKNLIETLGDSKRRVSSLQLDKISRSETNLRKNSKVDTESANRLLKIFSLGDGTKMWRRGDKNESNSFDKVRVNLSIADDVF